MGIYRFYGVFLRHFTCKDPLKSSNFPCAPLHVTSLMVHSVYNCIIELLQMHYKPRFISPNMANLNAFFLWGLSSLMRRTLALGQCCRTKPKSQCLYISTVSSQRLLSALYKQFKLQSESVQKRQRNLKKILAKSSENDFIFSAAFYLIFCLMKDPKNIKKVVSLKSQQLVSFRGVKTHFGKLAVKLCIIRHEKKKISTNIMSQLLIQFRTSHEGFECRHPNFWSWWSVYEVNSLCSRRRK